MLDAIDGGWRPLQALRAPLREQASTKILRVLARSWTCKILDLVRWDQRCSCTGNVGELRRQCWRVIERYIERERVRERERERDIWFTRRAPGIATLKFQGAELRGSLAEIDPWKIRHASLQYVLAAAGSSPPDGTRGALAQAMLESCAGECRAGVRECQAGAGECQAGRRHCKRKGFKEVTGSLEKGRLHRCRGNCREPFGGIAFDIDVADICAETS